MNQKERKLIYSRLINQYHDGEEPLKIKKLLDNKFRKKFTVDPLKEPSYIVHLTELAISEKNDEDLDLLISLCEHFEITKHIDEVIAPLLIQPWHNQHDRIALILEFDQNEATIDWLFLGATYTCDNLDYQSDYCEFNRKCLYALSKIGTEKALNYIKEVSACSNTIIAEHAKNFLDI